MSNQQTIRFNVKPEWMQANNDTLFVEQQLRALIAEEVARALAAFKAEMDNERHAREEAKRMAAIRTASEW